MFVWFIAVQPPRKKIQSIRSDVVLLQTKIIVFHPIVHTIISSNFMQKQKTGKWITSKYFCIPSRMFNIYCIANPHTQWLFHRSITQLPPPVYLSCVKQATFCTFCTFTNQFNTDTDRTKSLYAPFFFLYYKFNVINLKTGWMGQFVQSFLWIEWTYYIKDVIIVL